MMTNKIKRKNMDMCSKSSIDDVRKKIKRKKRNDHHKNRTMRMNDDASNVQLGANQNKGLIFG